MPLVKNRATLKYRIAELEGKIPALQIIDPKSVDAGERIVFGATVGLYDEDDDISVTYQIVGDDEYRYQGKPYFRLFSDRSRFDR